MKKIFIFNVVLSLSFILCLKNKSTAQDISAGKRIFNADFKSDIGLSGAGYSSIQVQAVSTKFVNSRFGWGLNGGIDHQNLPLSGALFNRGLSTNIGANMIFVVLPEAKIKPYVSTLIDNKFTLFNGVNGSQLDYSFISRSEAGGLYFINPTTLLRGGVKYDITNYRFANISLKERNLGFKVQIQPVFDQVLVDELIEDEPLLEKGKTMLNGYAEIIDIKERKGRNAYRFDMHLGHFVGNRLEVGGKVKFGREVATATSIYTAYHLPIKERAFIFVGAAYRYINIANLTQQTENYSAVAPMFGFNYFLNNNTFFQFTTDFYKTNRQFRGYQGVEVNAGIKTFLQQTVIAEDEVAILKKW
jgi:hypothetical protein